MQSIRVTAISFDSACRQAGVSYVFIGGLAVMAWGQPRATMDVDTLVRLRENQVETLVHALRSEGLEASREDFLDALKDRTHVTVFDPSSGFHIDVKLATDEYEVQEVESAVTVTLEGGEEVRVARPEDVVGFKLSFGTAQDIQDARSILVRQGDRIDRERLRDVANRLGVMDRLHSLESDQ